MAEKSKKKVEDDNGAAGVPGDSGGTTATAKPKKATKRAPKKRPPGHLPLWKVLLHNDDKNAMDFVVVTIVEITPLNKQEAPCISSFV